MYSLVKPHHNNTVQNIFSNTLINCYTELQKKSFTHCRNLNLIIITEYISLIAFILLKTSATFPCIMALDVANFALPVPATLR